MRVAPEIRWVCYGLLIFGVIVLLLVSSASVVNYRAQRKSETMLRNLLVLRIGESNVPDVRRAFGETGLFVGDGYTPKCNGPMSSYGVFQSSPTWRLVQQVPVLQRFGFHPWGAAASASVDKTGQSMCVDV